MPICNRNFLSLFVLIWDVGEAYSLQMIEQAAPGLAPLVFRTGTTHHKESEDEDDEEQEEEECPFTISQYKYLQPLNGTHSTQLAERLALELHVFTSDKGIPSHQSTVSNSSRLFF